MGRTQPTVRNMIESRRDEMTQYRRVLRMIHQNSYDRLWEHAATDAPNIKAAGLIDVDFGLLFAICRGQQYQIEQLQKRVDELEASHGD